MHSQWLLDSRRQTIQACVWTHVLRHQHLECPRWNMNPMGHSGHFGTGSSVPHARLLTNGHDDNVNDDDSNDVSTLQ